MVVRSTERGGKGCVSPYFHRPSAIPEEIPLISLNTCQTQASKHKTREIVGMMTDTETSSCAAEARTRLSPAVDVVTDIARPACSAAEWSLRFFPSCFSCPGKKVSLTELAAGQMLKPVHLGNPRGSFECCALATATCGRAGPLFTACRQPCKALSQLSRSFSPAEIRGWVPAISALLGRGCSLLSLFSIPSPRAKGHGRAEAGATSCDRGPRACAGPDCLRLCGR